MMMFKCCLYLSDGSKTTTIGTCLTITDFTSSTFKVGVSPETLRRTNLGSLQPTSSTSTPTTATATTTTAPATRSRVNLERAVAATTRMGGHFVQGHVDTIATIERVEPDGEALTFRLRPRERDVLRHVVEKGYVTLDGASLTVTKVDDVRGWWEVMLVAYTQDKVVMAAKREGEHVNVEVDMLGKYVDKSVRAYFDALESPDAEAPKAESTGMMGVLEKLVQRAVDERMKANGGSGEAR